MFFYDILILNEVIILLSPSLVTIWAISIALMLILILNLLRTLLDKHLVTVWLNIDVLV